MFYGVQKIQDFTAFYFCIYLILLPIFFVKLFIWILYVCPTIHMYCSLPGYMHFAYFMYFTYFSPSLGSSSMYAHNFKHVNYMLVFIHTKNVNIDSLWILALKLLFSLQIYI
ncbi:hypothetical protein D1007_45263 [Hordeum vulgare]|nr:hypothetical protein D1007_45263 [Hordeum vulgare]